ncbi:TerC family protein [Isoptericola sp. b441]|uniref:TerC family protein n=1 Tax=Actinotalea lenta TaxID=3064654 RepID=A0ABT9DBV4_9CELL|nr:MULTISPECIES: TerC family protein [unclassified Isoptericola]MDO8107663.1 TerC family protein [Isoptericola sp. b441]MDO8120677.1 TerC family protein [Isoptericola sp. b490]
MNVPLWVWGATVLGVLLLVALDFFVHLRTAHMPTFRESARWSAAYIGVAVLFGVGVLVLAGPDRGTEFFAGYLTEWSLSVDNLFVFLLILTRFGVPREHQQKVLLVGIAIALLLRGGFIAVGAVVIAQFSWVFYVFGAFLVYAAVQVAREDHDSAQDAEFHENLALRLVRRVVPATTRYHGDRLTVVEHGRRLVTPMLVVMVAIGTTDVIFALDSIPAIFGLTKEPYIVFTANAFALLGLRQLFFLIGGLLERLVYLSEGIAVVLGFIGVKLVLEALHGNDLPFVNAGEPVAWAPEIPTLASLGVIVAVLAVAAGASLVHTRRRRDDSSVAGADDAE